jgi:hypothetical protein
MSIIKAARPQRSIGPHQDVNTGTNCNEQILVELSYLADRILVFLKGARRRRRGRGEKEKER